MCEEFYVGCPKCGTPADSGEILGSGYVTAEETFTLDAEGQPAESVELRNDHEWPEEVNYWCKNCQDSFDELNEECVPEDCECAECSEEKDYVLDDTVVARLHPSPELYPVWLRFRVAPHYGEPLRDELLTALDSAPEEVRQITETRLVQEVRIEDPERCEEVQTWLWHNVDEPDRLFNFYYKEEPSGQAA
jgi:hypothetical protein